MKTKCLKKTIDLKLFKNMVKIFKELYQQFKTKLYYRKIQNSIFFLYSSTQQHPVFAFSNIGLSSVFNIKFSRVDCRLYIFT